MAANDDLLNDLRSARVPSAVERVILRIRELLLARKLRPGDRLPSEPELMRALGVGRGSIREAMKILSGYGIVTIRAGDGTYISGENRGAMFEPMLLRLLLSRSDRHHLVELRHLIEAGMVPMLVEHAKQEDIAGLRLTVDRTRALVAENCSDPDTLIEADLAFHRALGQATHNPLVERIYDFVMDFLTPTIRDTYVKAGNGTVALQAHTDIVEAIEAADRPALTEAVDHSIRAWVDLGE